MTFRRLSLEEEEKLLLQESEETNRENFREILKYFQLCQEDYNRVCDLLDGKIEKDNTYLNILLKLNYQGRAWYETDDKNEGFVFYIAEVLPQIIRNANILKKEKLLESLQCAGLASYEVFMKNKITINKQEHKLLKLLANEELVTKNTINYLNQIKSGQTNLICISRNPIDYIFISTNQNFGSCMDMVSFGEGWWLGLGGLSLDPNRLLIFSSTGKIKRFSIQSIELKHFGYVNRSWGLLSENDKIAIVRQYPGTGRELNNILVHLELNTNYFSNSKFKFLVPKLHNNLHSFPYIDNIPFFIPRDEKGFYSTENQSLYGKSSIDTSLCISIQNISENYDLDDNSYSCANCSDSIGEDECCWAEDDGPYCRDCFNDNFFYCSDCGEVDSLENAYSVSNGDYICSDCFNNYYFMCEDCEDTTNQDDESIVSGICSNCFRDNYFECEYCNKGYKNNEMSAIEDVCKDCFLDNYFECEKCCASLENNERSDLGNICKTCVDKHFFLCEKCEEIIEGDPKNILCGGCSNEEC